MKTRVNKIHPHIGGGNPVVSSMKRIYFNDILGTTIGAKKDSRYYPAAITAFGETLETGDPHFQAYTRNSCTFFTGKPQVEGLGYTFLFRNYRATLAKWQTADPIGYPDGWNDLRYGYNAPMLGVDIWGCSWSNYDFVSYYFFGGGLTLDTDIMGLTSFIFDAMIRDASDTIKNYVRSKLPNSSGSSFRNGFSFGVDCESIVFALGGGSGKLLDELRWSWYTCEEWVGNSLYECKYYSWVYNGKMRYSDDFRDPLDVLNLIDYDIEVPGGTPYSYFHVWQNVSLSGSGVIRKLLE